MEENILQSIKIEALKNAVKFKGKCNPKAVLGGVIKEFPEAKENMEELLKEVNKISKEINELEFEKQKSELLAYDFNALNKKPKKPKKDLLKDLPNVKPNKKVVMRFAPSPSGPMHIGHVFSGMPTSLYCEKYKGKFILRIEDTNPENVDIECYEMIKKDADWVFGNVSEVWIQSERIETYYEYAEKLIKSRNAYVCNCDNEEFKKKIWKKETCPCRELEPEKNMEKWKKMLNSEFKQGEAVLRFKADLNNKNPALRDFPIARINEAEHPLTGKKYRVWPLMNLSVSVDDLLAEMTHIIRAKEHQINAERQKMIYSALGINEFPETIFLGRWKFEGLEISCSKTKERISKGEFSCWNDIRLPFLAALRRRGYQPEAFKKFVLNVGVTSTDKKMDSTEFFKALNSFNKEVIDPVAKRFFFISDMQKIEINNCPELNLELDLHPDNVSGGRKFFCKGKFILNEKDLKDSKENELIRLMDCLNFKKVNDKYVFDSLDYGVFKKSLGKKIIHWLPDSKDLINVEVLMPDNTKVKGVAEANIKQVKINEVIQFERFGFCRLDSVDNNVYKFWFAHR